MSDRLALHSPPSTSLGTHTCKLGEKALEGSFLGGKDWVPPPINTYLYVPPFLFVKPIPDLPRLTPEERCKPMTISITNTKRIPYTVVEPPKVTEPSEEEIKLPINIENMKKVKESTFFEIETFKPISYNRLKKRIGLGSRSKGNYENEKAQNALSLSGTPALSRPIELFKHLEALYPDVYKNVHEYGNQYCNNVFLDLVDNDMKQINALFREETHNNVGNLESDLRKVEDVVTNMLAKGYILRKGHQSEQKPLMRSTSLVPR
ncbi:hypothetical protein Fmac_008827 [Flemingia macrophylla]|uniref:Uncharacterized protein n=1 Tax=Flemingia macrophylla TaxID=520843 RepID=A0ABD1MYH1_9FABA